MSKKLGRPSKLTPELQSEIVLLVKGGNYIETACAMAGISRSTYYDWMEKGKQSTGSNRFTEFRDAVEKAKAWAEARDVAIISRHAEKVWRAAAWLLERKYPKRWGRIKHKKKGKVSDQPVEHDENIYPEYVPREDQELEEYAKCFKYLELGDLEDKEKEEDVQKKRPISTAEIEFFVKRKFYPKNPKNNPL